MAEVITRFFRTVAETAEAARGELIRMTGAAYADGQAEPTASDVDAEQVAYHLFTQGDRSVENPFGLSSLWIFWGQFVDHDIDLTPDQTGADAEMMKDEPPFSVTRSTYIVDEDGVRQQVNTITPEIDGSNIYGSNIETQIALRTLEGGHLKTSAGPHGARLLPTSDQVFGDGGTAFVSGDVRVIENTALTSLHTTFVNEHNYWADRIAAADPTLTDEEIFQQARAVVEALIQKITYEEFLPILLGTGLAPYTGYDAMVSTAIATEFSTAAFRFGHTAIPDQFTYAGEDGSETRAPDSLFALFNNSLRLIEDGTGDTLRGLLETKAQKIDTLVVDSLNFFLFTPDGGLTGFSLPERNILRGRDHGIDTYLDVRDAVVGDISAVEFAGSDDFSVITSDEGLQAALRAVYGTVDKVDLWVGGLAEDYAPGVTVGVTFQAILVDQFTRLRDGDPFFYLNREWASDAIESEIMDTRLSDVLMRSGGMDYAQRDALLASDRIGGGEGNDLLQGGAGRDLIIGFGGNDRLYGNGGDDDIFGGAGNDWLDGGEGNDALTGEAGIDHMSGGAGDDILSGGDGRDYLHGGPGADRFVFHAGESDYDTVLDYEPGTDSLVLKGYGADFGDLEILDSRGGVMLMLGTDAIAMLRGIHPDDLSPDDFIFIG